MSDTPETDKAERMAFSNEYMVPTECARQLERERDYAQKDARLLSERLTALELSSTNDLATLEIERDEAKAWAEKLQTVAMQHSIHAENAERERDEARQIIADALSILPCGHISSHTPSSIPSRIRDLVESWVTAERERDEALQMIIDLKQNIASHCDEQLRLVFENRRLRQEIDEAREELANLESVEALE